MQFQVPQFIETEDKIVGPFTIKQFLFVAAAGGLSFLLYITVQVWLWAILSVFILGMAASLSFIKIEGRPLSHVLISAFSFYWKPQTYTWQQEGESRVEAKSAAPGISLEDVVSGMALRSVWEKLQTGSKVSNRQFFGKTAETYQIFRKMTGERRAARRIDYR